MVNCCLKGGSRGFFGSSDDRDCLFGQKLHRLLVLRSVLVLPFLTFHATKLVLLPTISHKDLCDVVSNALSDISYGSYFSGGLQWRNLVVSARHIRS